METILLKAKAVRAARRKDGSVSLTVETVGEISPGTFMLIDSSLGVAGYVSLSPNPSDASNVPEERVEDGSKSQSQRMRGVIFVMWEQSAKKREGVGFEEYYRGVTEVFINHCKSRLDKAEPAF